MITKDKITTGAIGLLAIISIVMGAGLLNQDNVYVCEERQLAMICDSLSKINDDSIHTRCYFNETFKVCDSGWIKFEKSEPIKKNNTLEFTDLICEKDGFIKECRANDGTVILRIKNE